MPLSRPYSQEDPWAVLPDLLLRDCNSMSSATGRNKSAKNHPVTVFRKRNILAEADPPHQTKKLMNNLSENLPQ